MKLWVVIAVEKLELLPTEHKDKHGGHKDKGADKQDHQS